MMMTYIHGCNYSLIPWLSTRAISGVCVWKLRQGQTTTTTVFCLQNFSGISLYNKVYSKSNMQNPCRDSWGCEWLGLGRLFCVHWENVLPKWSKFLNMFSWNFNEVSAPADVLSDFVYKFNSIWKVLNSLWPNDAIWRHRSGSPFAQVMAWCLMAPSHYMSYCWLIINQVSMA